MNLLTAENIAKNYTEKELLTNISLGINEGDKIGLIGINGTGKSTLLRILAGIEEADKGTVIKGTQVTVEYLPQTPIFDEKRTILENVILERKPKNKNWNVEGEARAMLLKFGIEQPEGSVGNLSGGQKKRAALVRALLASADILVLDEPTNHLDNEMAEWLEDYLKKADCAVLMVTHDRYFLDQVSNRIVEIDHGQLYQYDGNYSSFLEGKAQRQEIAAATERKNVAMYRQNLEWIQRGARARTTKQKAHIARFEELRDRKRLEAEQKIEMSSIASRLGKSTIELEHLSKAYGSKKLFEDFSYIFLKNDRIGIIGHNGSGKSTLLKVINGEIVPDAGSVNIGQTVRIGYFSQENEEMDPTKRVIDYIRDVAEIVDTVDGKITASKMLEKFLFSDALQYARIEKLSGGERRRLYLLRVLMEMPNVLILDEPTNDLDIQTLCILEDYLDSFPGIVIAVSHDRYFLDRVVDRIFALEGNGAVRTYHGGYTQYQTLASERTEESKKDKTEKISDEKRKPDRENKLRFSYQEQKDYDIIEKEIAALEERIQELDTEMEGYTTQYTQLQCCMKQKEEAEQKLEEKMDRWMYLSDLAERIATQTK